MRMKIHDLFWNRDPKSIKTDYGKVAIVGGSLAYPGAIGISTNFASLAGAGYVELMTPMSIYQASLMLVPLEVVHLGTNKPSSFDDFLQFHDDLLTTDVLLFGNGAKYCKDNAIFLETLLSKYEGTLIIDATGLRLLSTLDERILLKKRKAKHLLLLPHLGEVKSLLKSNQTSRDVMDYKEEAINYAKKYHLDILLKSYESLLVTKEGEYFLSSYSPNASLAKAGSGDALAGFLAGLLAYGEKKIPYSSLIMEGDNLFHEAAIQLGSQVSPGLTNLEALAISLKSLIAKNKS